MKLLQHTYILLSLVAVMAIIPLSKISGTKDTSNPITASEKTFVISDTSLEGSSSRGILQRKRQLMVFLCTGA